MEQQPEISEVLEEFNKAKAEGRQRSAHIAKNPYKQNNPSISAITGSGTTKQKDMKEMNQP